MSGELQERSVASQRIMVNVPAAAFTKFRGKYSENTEPSDALGNGGGWQHKLAVACIQEMAEENLDDDVSGFTVSPDGSLTEVGENGA